MAKNSADKFMSTEMTIKFTPSEGALPRLLGAIERRGFMVTAVDMAEHGDQPTANLALKLAARSGGGCTTAALERHISLLADVVDISVYSD